MRGSWKCCLLTSRSCHVPKILPRPREKNNISGQLKLMHGDTLNRGQGLLPYGGPGCKSEERGGVWGAERSGRPGIRKKSDAASTAQKHHPLKPSDLSQDCSSATHLHPPSSFIYTFLHPLPLQHPKVQHSQVSV